MRWLLKIPNTKARMHHDDGPKVIDSETDGDISITMAAEQVLKHVLAPGMYELSSIWKPGFVQLATLNCIDDFEGYAYYVCDLLEDDEPYRICISGLFHIFDDIPDKIYVKHKEV